jgi:hypothetical protein
MHLLKLEFPISTLFCEGDISVAPFVSNSNRPCKLDKYRQLFICAHNETFSVLAMRAIQTVHLTIHRLINSYFAKIVR